MSSECQLHVLDPVFFHTMLEVPAIYGMWCGRGDVIDGATDIAAFKKLPQLKRALAGRPLGKPTSLDDHLDLQWWLDAIVKGYEVLDPDEAGAYRAIGGSSETPDEFRPHRFGTGTAWGFDVPTTRRVAGLFLAPAKRWPEMTESRDHLPPESREVDPMLVNRLAWRFEEAMKKRKTVLIEWSG